MGAARTMRLLQGSEELLILNTEALQRLVAHELLQHLQKTHQTWHFFWSVGRCVPCVYWTHWRSLALL